MKKPPFLNETALAAYLVENAYLTDAALADAIAKALADAKASGEFDGAPGKDGMDGADGQPGKDGVTPNLQIGTVDTLPAGSPATASLTGTPENPLLNLGIPKGADGTGESITDEQAAQIEQNAADITDLKSDIGLLQNDVAQIADTWELIEKFTVEEEAVIQRRYAGKYRKILIIARQDTDKLPKFRLISTNLFWEFYGFGHYQHGILCLMGETVIPGVFSDVRSIAGSVGGNASIYYPIVNRLVNTENYFKGFKSDNVCKVGTTINVYGVSV